MARRASAAKAVKKRVPAKQSRQEVAVVAGPPETALELVLRAARDSSVSAEKVERLMAMHRQMIAEEARLAFIDARLAVDRVKPIIQKNGTILVYSKEDREWAKAHDGQLRPNARPIQATSYALMSDLVRETAPILNDNGITVRFDTTETPDHRVAVTCFLTHRSGHIEPTSMPSMPLDTTGSKNNNQAVASTVSYGKRQALIAALTIETREPEHNDDGAGGKPIVETITEEQYRALAEEIRDQSSEPVKLLTEVTAHFKIDTLSDLPASRYDDCVMRLAERRKAAAERRP